MIKTNKNLTYQKKYRHLNIQHLYCISQVFLISCSPNVNTLSRFLNHLTLTKMVIDQDAPTGKG